MTSSSLEQSKIISYHPAQSICGSDNNSIEADNKATMLGSDSVDSSDQVGSQKSLQHLSSNLYRYVTSFGAHQIETSTNQVFDGQELDDKKKTHINSDKIYNSNYCQQ